MENPQIKPKIGKLFVAFAVMGIIALPLIIFKAFSVSPGEAIAEVNTPVVSETLDHNAKQLYDTYTDTTPIYMQGTATQRTLDY